MDNSAIPGILKAALSEIATGRPKWQLFVLTGAGISRESGLATFRDAGGLWNQYRVEDVATPEAFERDPQLVHRFYNERRRDVLAAQPNAGHAALAELKRMLGDRMTLVTQNIDDLHERAGSTDVVHMHGEIRRMRCVASGHIFACDEDASVETPCPQCRSRVRPHVVWFGEMPLEMTWIYEALQAADVFCAIGTSGRVYPAAGFVAEVAAHDGLCIEINPEQAGGPFQIRLMGPASAQVPLLVEAVREAGLGDEGG